MTILIYIPSWDEFDDNLSRHLETWRASEPETYSQIEILSNTEFIGRPPIRVQEFDGMEIFICRGDKGVLERVRDQLDLILMKDSEDYLPSDNPSFYRFAKIITE